MLPGHKKPSKSLQRFTLLTKIRLLYRRINCYNKLIFKYFKKVVFHITATVFQYENFLLPQQRHQNCCHYLRPLQFYQKRCLYRIFLCWTLHHSLLFRTIAAHNWPKEIACLTQPYLRPGQLHHTAEGGKFFWVFTPLTACPP